MKDKMLTFMAGHKHCVISTVDSNSKPESAFVAFSNNELDIFIGTSSQSRKFRNLTANPAVAIVIADQSGEVQYEGAAHVVEAHEISEVEKRHFTKLPGSATYRNDPNQQYIKISPTWIRFIQHGEPDIIEEFTEF